MSATDSGFNISLKLAMNTVFFVIDEIALSAPSRFRQSSVDEPAVSPAEKGQDPLRNISYHDFYCKSTGGLKVAGWFFPQA
jgi:uncharacterized lipoprotein YddW (UPF0748 family)